MWLSCPMANMLSQEGSDSTARIWDVASGQTLHVLTGHDAAITRLAVSPDGKYIVTGKCGSNGSPLGCFHR